MGKWKERTKTVTEKNVNIRFTQIDSQNDGKRNKNNNQTCKVEGSGLNEFGLFHLDGTAEPSPYEDKQ
jgi:hypothetical protein